MTLRAHIVPTLKTVQKVFIFAISVRTLGIAAAQSEQVRVYEIYQSNNNADVIVNLSLKLHERK